MAYEYEWKVRAGDTDYSGLLYTPRLVDCAIQGIEDLRAEVGFTNEFFQEAPYVPPVANVDINYRDTMLVDDTLQVSCTPTVGERSVTYRFDGLVEDDPVFDGTVTTVFIKKETETPRVVPESFERGLQEYRTDSTTEQ